MTIVVTLSPELEALLRDRAVQRGEDVSFIASELLASALESVYKQNMALLNSGMNQAGTGTSPNLR